MVSFMALIYDGRVVLPVDNETPIFLKGETMWGFLVFGIGLIVGAVAAAAQQPLRQYLSVRAEAAKALRAALEKLIEAGEQTKENGKEK